VRYNAFAKRFLLQVCGAAFVMHEIVSNQVLGLIEIDGVSTFSEVSKQILANFFGDT
jgi:hypothetical protein